MEIEGIVMRATSDRLWEKPACVEAFTLAKDFRFEML